MTERTQERKLTVDGLEYDQTTRYFDFDAGRNAYTVSYVSRVNSKTREYSAGNPGVCGIGIIGPSDRGGWGRDFINVAANREELTHCKPEISAKAGLGKASVNFRWTWKSGKIVDMCFLTKAADPFLYVRVRIGSPGGGIVTQPFVITLVTSPAPRSHAPEPYLRTGNRKVSPEQDILLNPDEKWVGYLDAYWDFAREGRASNAAGLVLDPKEFKEAKVLVHGSMTTYLTTLRGQAQLALLETRETGNEDFVGILTQNAPAVLGNLAAADFFLVEKKIRIQPPGE